MKPSLVTFDLDGTLIRNTTSTQLLCWLNGKKSEAQEVVEQIFNGSLDWIEADYMIAKLMKGIREDDIDGFFGEHAIIIDGLSQLLKELDDRDIPAIVVTTGPKEVAECVKRRWPFKAAYGGTYEKIDGCFTGEISRHLMHHGGKYACVEAYARQNGLDMTSFVAVGDSYSDLELFSHCAHSVAINYTQDMVGHASLYYKTENIMDILPALTTDLFTIKV